MRKLVLACWILVGAVSVSMGAMSEKELLKATDDCFGNGDKIACQAIIDNNGLPSVEQCDNRCGAVGALYNLAGRYREAIPYFEKAIVLGDNRGYGSLADVYYNLQDYYNAKKYYEIACNKDYELACAVLGQMYDNEQGVSQNYHKAYRLYIKACDMKFGPACYNLGVLYHEGRGVRQDYARAHELYKKACDMKYGDACNNLAVLYDKGLGVRQNLSTAKHYSGKACDLGNQMGCDNYKLLNSQGVQ